VTTVWGRDDSPNPEDLVSKCDEKGRFRRTGTLDLSVTADSAREFSLSGEVKREITAASVERKGNAQENCR